MPRLPALALLLVAACTPAEPQVVTFAPPDAPASPPGHAGSEPAPQAIAKSPRTAAPPAVSPPGGSPSADAGSAMAPAAEPAPSDGPATVRDALGDLERLAGAVRIAPAFDDNRQPNGLKLAGIPRGSVIERLGFRDGDTIHAVDGASVTNIVEALDVAAKLDDPGVREVRFSVSRAGAPRTIVVDLEGPMP